MLSIERVWELMEAMPRRSRAPSERNLQIYEAVRVAGQSQSEVAEAFGLCQARISQIVQSVEKWRRPEHLVEENAQHESLEQRLEFGRHEQLYQQAIRAFDRSHESIETVRTGNGRRGEWSERIVRERHADPSLLTRAYRANQTLGKLSQRESAVDPRAVWEARLTIVLEVLIHIRQRAEFERRVSRSEGASRAVQRVLTELLGPPSPQTAADGEFPAIDKVNSDECQNGRHCEVVASIADAAKCCQKITCNDAERHNSPVGIAPRASEKSDFKSDRTL